MDSFSDMLSGDGQGLDLVFAFENGVDVILCRVKDEGSLIARQR